MLRYKLRTLLILLAVLPPLLWVGWTKYAAWKAEQARKQALEPAAVLQRLSGNVTVEFLDRNVIVVGQEPPPGTTFELPDEGLSPINRKPATTNRSPNSSGTGTDYARMLKQAQEFNRGGGAPLPVTVPDDPRK